MKADKTYYLDEKRELTTKEPLQGIVLINEGQDIPREMADKYGIGKVAQEEEKAEKETVKKSASSSENKSAKAKEDK